MTRLEKALVAVAADLRRIGASFALVGGLALSVRAEPRTTRDLDVVIATEDDPEAERIVSTLRDRGYKVGELLEETTTGRLATVRLLFPDDDELGVVIDLLFHSSGLEPEIVADAEPIEISPGVDFPVARRGHLIALKLLARRDQDLVDAQSLLQYASDEDLDLARRAVDRITSLGLDRGSDLLADLDRLTTSHR